VEASYWSRSLESDATVRADYALTTPTKATYTWFLFARVVVLGVAWLVLPAVLGVAEARVVSVSRVLSRVVSPRRRAVVVPRRRVPVTGGAARRRDLVQTEPVVFRVQFRSAFTQHTSGLYAGLTPMWVAR